MFDAFLVHALLAGCLLSVIAGPIGSVMLYRRLSVFSDAISHNALLGIATGVLFGIGSGFTIWGIAILSGLIFFALYSKNFAKSDTLLVIISQVGLASGMICISLSPSGSGRMTDFLFGDILAITTADIITIIGVGGVILLTLKLIWNKLLLLAFDAETAIAENGSLKWVNITFILLLASFIAISVKLIGVLLITALLIIPATAARFHSKAPETMAILASVFGVFSVIMGTGISYVYNFPTAPSIVISAALLALIAYFFKLPLKNKVTHH